MNQTSQLGPTTHAEGNRTVIRTRAAVLITILGLLAMALTSVAPSGAVAASKDPSQRSGGKAIAHKGDGRRIQNRAVTSRAPVAKISRLGVASGEPTIGVSNSGNVFTAAIQSNTRVNVMRSKDRGKSWEIVSPNIAGRNTQLLSLDPYTYVDTRLGDADSSRVFTIDLTVACSILSFSDDEGDSWITNPLACGRPVNDHQTLFTGPPVSSPTVGYPNLVYYCWNDVASSSCSKSIDGGLTFRPTGVPAYQGVGSEGFCGGLHGHGFVDDAGNVYLPREYCGNPWVAISRDEGTSWETIQISDKISALNGESDPSVAVDSKGNIFYLWIGDGRMPYLSVSKNDGKSWSKPINVAPPGLREANLPSVAANGKGKIAITYMGSYNSPNNPNVRCGGDAEPCPGGGDYAETSWDGVMTVSADALSKDPTFYTSTVNAKQDPIYRGQCGPGRCGVVYDFIDIIIDREGTAWAAFVDGCQAICVSGNVPNVGNEGIVGYLAGGPRLK